MKFWQRSVGLSNNLILTIKIGSICVVLFYFIFHAISGENGLISYVKIKKDLAEKERLYNELDHKRATIQHKVSLLGADNLDLDLLEEQAGIVIGYTRQSDIIVK